MPAKSPEQQKAAGMALSAKRGKTPVSKLKGAAKQMYNNMNEKQLRDFAETKHNQMEFRQRLDDATKYLFD